MGGTLQHRPLYLSRLGAGTGPAMRAVRGDMISSLIAGRILPICLWMLWGLLAAL